jgi:hypothetical protein
MADEREFEEILTLARRGDAEAAEVLETFASPSWRAFLSAPRQANMTCKTHSNSSPC